MGLQTMGNIGKGCVSRAVIYGACISLSVTASTRATGEVPSTAATATDPIHSLPPATEKLKPYKGPVIPDPTPRLTVSEETVEYAFAGASFGAAIAYCSGKYGPLQNGSAGSRCFQKAKQVLSRIDLDGAIVEARTQCRAENLRT